MKEIEAQISELISLLVEMRDRTPVDKDAAGVTLETHSPGNGTTYKRLRAARGQRLANGKRTMALKGNDANIWEAKIRNRNQLAKIERMVLLLEQVNEIALSLNEQPEAPPLALNPTQVVPLSTVKPLATESPINPANIISYAFKGGKGATPMNRKVHAIQGPEPPIGYWETPALCGEVPSLGSWGWEGCHSSDLSCPKCARKLAARHERRSRIRRE